MSRSERPIVVAIDGPGGVGKSTAARALAERLGVPYLETGAMYRALGLKTLEIGVDPADEGAVVGIAASLDLDLTVLEDGRTSILLDGEPLGERIRDEAVARTTSVVAALPGVRRRMVDLQRRFGEEVGGVVEGRDIGTRVFPDTPFKFFLEADAEVRAGRRHGEHASRGSSAAGLETLRRELEKRDRRDAERADSPLRKDESYRVIDTTRLTAEEVVERMWQEIERRR